MPNTTRRIGWGVMLATVAGTGCAVSGPRRAAEPAVPMLACRVSNYAPYESAAYEHLKSIGVRHVFIAVPAPDQVDKTQQELAKYGLDAVVMRGGTDLSKEACVEELGRQTEVCHRMGVKYMFLSAKRNGADKAVVYDRLRRAGDIARKNGVTIVLETHPDLGTNAAVHRETMRAVGHPNVRVNFDTGNTTYYNRGANTVTELKQVIDLVATVEFKDHNGEFETWNFPPLGKGVVDFPSLLRVLKEHGYAGPITMEIEGVKGVERSEAQIKKDIADSVAYLKSIGEFR